MWTTRSCSGSSISVFPPLYISVHATEPALRARMLGNAEYDGFLEKVETVSRCGITVHGQVVLCPEWNDGEHLDRTIADMARLHPGVGSLAVVPVGLTKHRKNPPAPEAVHTG
jgi:NifB/MoaA-like Fe-S oxidoreductase